jgi:hypothetical protein
MNMKSMTSRTGGWWTCFVAFLITVGISVSLPVTSFADVVVFKDGRKLQVEKAWVEGNEVKAKVAKGVIGFQKESVARIEEKPTFAPSDSAFKFDKWFSGMTISEVMDLSETHDVPIQKVGVVSSNKHFNPNVRNDAGAEAAFYYKDNLLGRSSTVTLSFSPVSRLLWSVGINWSGITTKSEFRNEVHSLLSEKYGKPKSRGKDLFYDTITWKISEMSVVSMKAGFGSIILSYVDGEIEAIKKDEELSLKESARKNYLLKDRIKY